MTEYVPVPLDLLERCITYARTDRGSVIDGDHLERLVSRFKGVKVTYNHGGSAVWTAVEESEGWWSIREWKGQGSTAPFMDAEYFEKNFTRVEEPSAS